MARGNRGNRRGRASRRPTARPARDQRVSTASSYVPDNVHGLFASSRATSRQLDSVTPQLENKPSNVQSNDADDESLDHIIMALNRMGNTSIGCAYYVARQRTLYCLEDIADADADVITSCWSKILLLHSSNGDSKTTS